MNKVTVRQLLRDFKKLELPVLVTRWGKPVCVVISYEDFKEVEGENNRPIGEGSTGNIGGGTTTEYDKYPPQSIKFS